MARITICDLCKERIRDDESKQGELTLSFYVHDESTEKVFGEDEGLMDKHTELTAELCLSCTTLLRKTIAGDDPLTPPESLQKKPEHFGAPAVEGPLANSYAPPGDAVGPSEEEKASREPTKELLDDEMVKVKSRFNKDSASKVVRKQKGSCAHHFKSFLDGKVRCGPAPDGMKGELSTFKGCGKTLVASEY